MKMMVRVGIVCVVLAANRLIVGAGPKSEDLPWVPMKNGRLFYGEDAAHNRMPDFSAVGYRRGEAAIPDVPMKSIGTRD